MFNYEEQSVQKVESWEAFLVSMEWTHEYL